VAISAAVATTMTTATTATFRSTSRANTVHHVIKASSEACEFLVGFSLCVVT
jgi:hypothetical protein